MHYYQNWKENKHKKTPNISHLLQLHSCFLPTMLFAVFASPSLHPCNITECFSPITALQEGKDISLLETFTSTTQSNSDPVSFSLVTLIHQEEKEVLAYTGVRSKQGLKIPHQLLGSSPLPGAGCSELPAHKAGSCMCEHTGCPLPMPQAAKMML